MCIAREEGKEKKKKKKILPNFVFSFVLLLTFDTPEEEKRNKSRRLFENDLVIVRKREKKAESLIQVNRINHQSR